jgi:hypothetical protein
MSKDSDPGLVGRGPLKGIVFPRRFDPDVIVLPEVKTDANGEETS